jgi:hypothetical protein
VGGNLKTFDTFVKSCGEHKAHGRMCEEWRNMFVFCV